MMPPLLPDLTTTSRIHPYDPFDQLPDSLLLLIFNLISDVKSLGRLSTVSTRFHSLIPLVQNVVVPVDCLISDSSSTTSSKSRFTTLFRTVLTTITKPIQTLGQLLSPKRPVPLTSPSPSSLSVGSLNGDGDTDDFDCVTHHSPAQVLKTFTDIRFLKIQLPAGELGLDDGVLLRWRADFGSTLNNCVMLGASSVIYPDNNNNNNNNNNNKDLTNSVNEDNGSIPESFYTNGGLKLRVVWTISSLIAASARHYLLQPIVSDHKTLDSVTLTDADGQGVLCMNKEQLEELRVKPLLASSASKRTLVPALNMRLWYAPCLELPDGTVLKGATLVATRPSDQAVGGESLDGVSVSDAFDEPFGTAAKMLVKRRTYFLEMNSF